MGVNISRPMQHLNNPIQHVQVPIYFEDSNFPEEDLRIYNLREQIFSQVKGISFQDKLDSLSLCNCCERHQINKPIYYSPWNETPFKFKDQDLYSCKCNCRHIARQICREHPEYSF